jgi:hypothetical protein
MSKKIIAVAAAAALALTGLVGTAPATAAMPYDDTGTQPVYANSLLITSTADRIGTAGTGTLAAPYLVNVPSSGLATSGTTLRFSISTTVARALTVSATSGIRLLAAVTDTTAVVLTGADALTVTADSAGAAQFWVYPTSTTRGVVTITNDGDLTQIYITGNVGPAYDIGAVTLPSLAPSAEGVIVAVVTDAFGNAVDEVNQTLTVTRVGTGVSTAAVDVQYSATSKRWEGTVTAGATAGQLAVGLTIAGLTATTAQKAAFGDPNNTFFGIINVSATKTVAQWEADIKVLNDRITALTADYNKLATRWNTRYDLKKAPKHKVVLK